MRNTIKFLTSKIIILNGKKYIPHKLHQLPKDYEEIPLRNQFSHKGFCYINSDFLNWSQDKENRFTSNFAIGGLAAR